MERNGWSSDPRILLSSRTGGGLDESSPAPDDTHATMQDLAVQDLAVQVLSKLQGPHSCGASGNTSSHPSSWRASSWRLSVGSLVCFGVFPWAGRPRIRKIISCFTLICVKPTEKRSRRFHIVDDTVVSGHSGQTCRSLLLAGESLTRRRYALAPPTSPIRRAASPIRLRVRARKIGVPSASYRREASSAAARISVYGPDAYSAWMWASSESAVGGEGALRGEGASVSDGRDVVSASVWMGASDVSAGGRRTMNRRSGPPQAGVRSGREGGDAARPLGVRSGAPEPDSPRDAVTQDPWAYT